MKRERDHLLALKRQIETGQYQVDCQLVAEAILRRMSQRGNGLRAAGPTLRKRAQTRRAVHPRR